MKLNHKIFGNGSPVVILHGLFGMLDNWRAIAKSLESDFQCILFDLRNHGKSPRDPNMDYKVMAADVLESMDDLGLKEAIIMGHSMGGKVAMRFAFDYPQRISKLIVVDIAPREYPPHHEDVIRAIEAIHPEKMKDRTEAENILRSELGEDEATIQFILKNLSRVAEGGFAWKANMPVLINSYASIITSVNSEEPFNKPVLFIRGEKSNSVQADDLTEINELFPDSRVITIKNAGHWVHADQPAALLDVILPFLQA
ncbi:MAG: alpha/beta fold hydrolase [Bacteroidota bacterium]|nr:alpha/beta fold hydrolase [Bacteroidota bacterium]